MPATELREDLEDRRAIVAEQIESWESDSAEGVMEPDDLKEWRLINERSKRLLDAVETIALPILEADPELVERLSALILKWTGRRVKAEMIEELLAAISTPTPGAE